MDPALLPSDPSPWWSLQTGNMLGAILGSCVGLLGAVLGVALPLCAPRGKGRLALLALQIGGGGLGIAVLAAGLAALALGQPYHVWYPLLLSGLLGAGVLLGLLPVTLAVYRAAEQRRLAASELRRA